MQVPFPTVIDSSLLSAWRSCRRKVWLEYFQHWKPRAQSVHLHAGKAFARGLEVARVAFYEEGKDSERAIAEGVGALLTEYGDFECPEDSPKSAGRMAGALEYNFHRFPMGSDPATPLVLPSGRRAIEFSFLEPLEVRHPTTGDPVLFAGRFDMVCNYGGGVFGEDDKTTGQLGASWSKQWDLRSQFTAYTWGAQRSGVPIQGFLVRGLAILKHGYNAEEAITYRPQWMVDEWYENTLEDVQEMVQHWEASHDREGPGVEGPFIPWRKNLDHACNEYGGCIFRKVCLSAKPETWLPVDFARRRWDPVTREEEVLE